MRSALVTIGLPVFNAERTLDLTLASILAQTFEDWRLVVIDDGSTDGSLDVVRRYRDGRIRVLTDGRNKGLSARLNELARLADTEFLARMDADDAMHPERLERQLERLSQGDLDVLGSAAFVFDTEERVYGVRGAGPFDASKAALGPIFLHPTVTGRTAWFRAHPYDSRFDRAEDYELWVRTANGGRFDRLREPLLFYRDAGVPQRRKYLRSMRQTLRVLAHHRGTVGTGAFARMTAKTFVGAAAYAVPFAPLEDALVRRRNAPVTAAQLEAARDALRTIRAFTVPPSLPLT